jgi:hypothetical protein
MNLFSPMKLVWHNYTIHLQNFHIISAHWLCILQMVYNLHRGHRIRELMQTVVESQHMLAKVMRQLVNRDAQHGHQGPEPN